MSTNMVFSNISNKSTGDRFIPNRSDCDINLAHFKLIGPSASKNQNNNNEDIFKQKPNQFFPYIKLLKNTVNYTESPILNFNRPCASSFKQKELNIILPPWPVNPRLNPVLSKPHTVLDLPNVTSDIVSNMLDWGNSGKMATISNNKVYLWSNKMEQNEEVIETNIPAYRALKWDHEGRYLAVAKKGAFAVWDMTKTKELLSQVCFCPYTVCFITSLAWDKTDKFLVTGCSEGIIRTWNLAKYPKHLFAENTIFAHYNSIITLEFSTNNKYLCSSSVDGLVRLWHWPILEPHFEIFSTSPVRGIAFHPWRDAILALGGGLGDGSLSVWNVNNFKRIDYLKPTRESFVDCLAWNPVTGELVSSHQVANKKDDTMDTKILVLSSLNRVVDVIDNHTGRVLYLMWDSTGTKLATAGSEENLCIWNFLGKKYSILENPVCKRKTKKSSKNVVLTFGKCIR